MEKPKEEVEMDVLTLIHRISHLGDDDEGISKHIIHSLTSICLGLTWEDNIDYKTGGWYRLQMEQLQLAEMDGIIHKGETRPQWLEICNGFDEENKANLGPLWDQVKAIADELGLEEFYNLLQDPMFERWHWGRLEMYANDHNRMNGTEIPSWMKKS